MSYAIIIHMHVSYDTMLFVPCYAIIRTHDILFLIGSHASHKTISAHENQFENVVCIAAATSFRCPHVK